MRMTSHTTPEQICSHQPDNNNNNNNSNEEEETCSICFHLKNMEENDSLLRFRRLNKNTNGDNILERSLTINIPCGASIATDKQPRVKRASSSVIRRSPNNKLLYRTLTPSCCPDSRKPITCRPPTPYFSEETQNNRRRSKQFSFEDDEEDEDREFEDTKL